MRNVQGLQIGNIVRYNRQFHRIRSINENGTLGLRRLVDDRKVIGDVSVDDVRAVLLIAAVMDAIGWMKSGIVYETPYYNGCKLRYAVGEVSLEKFNEPPLHQLDTVTELHKLQNLYHLLYDIPMSLGNLIQLVEKEPSPGVAV